MITALLLYNVDASFQLRLIKIKLLQLILRYNNRISVSNKNLFFLQFETHVHSLYAHTKSNFVSQSAFTAYNYITQDQQLYCVR